MPRGMKRVLVTGGSGFIGRKLAAELVARGDQVTVLTRNVASARKSLPSGVRTAAWNPAKEGPWAEELEVVDAVVHLAGESVAQRWTDEKKKAIEHSRVDSTRLLVEAIGRAKKRPAVFVCASATGFYGPQPSDVELDESAPAGRGFLASVVERWEAEAQKASEHGVRAVEVRIGVVLGEGGGALEKMIVPFKMFAGGPLGDGRQVVSWVHRDDVVGILLLSLDNAEVSGPINAVSPNAATSKELADAIGIVLGRPSWFKTPESMLKIAMGEAAEILVTGQRVFPKRAAELGYEFRHARLVPALESILAPA
jgi:uncharacterized protein